MNLPAIRRQVSEVATSEQGTIRFSAARMRMPHQYHDEQMFGILTLFQATATLRAIPQDPNHGETSNESFFYQWYSLGPGMV